MANRRKVCRIHITRVSEYDNLVVMLHTLSIKLAHQPIPAFHPGTDQCYIYVGFDVTDILSAVNHDKHNNHKTLGRLFGYPECCITAFCVDGYNKDNNRDI